MRNPYAEHGEQLAAQFYDWERRGRGWDVYASAVELEPPFRPFFSHWVWQPDSPDDGRRPGLLNFGFGRRGAPAASAQLVEDPDALEPQPRFIARPSASELSEFELLLPEDFAPRPGAQEALVAAVQVSAQPISFELLGQDSSVRLLFCCRRQDAASLRSQIQAASPDAAFLPRPEQLQLVWGEAAGAQLIVDVGLSREFMRPLKTLRSFNADPLTGLISAVAEAGAGEVVVVQTIATGARQPWAESILRAVRTNDGAPFELLGPDLTHHANSKTDHPLYAVRLRLAAKATARGRCLELLRGVGAALRQFAEPSGSELLALDSQDWPEPEQEADLLYRTSCRPGMLLNAPELAALLHLPGKEVHHPALRRLTGRTRPLPAICIGQRFILGENEHLGQVTPVSLSLEQRRRHTYLIGGTGTGKSTLLASMIAQDLEAGHGLALLDPHGDLIDEVLGRIPESRRGDVVLFDPADEDYPVGFNVLSAHSELERTLLASDLVAVFRRLSTSWGDQMNSVFANAILAMLEGPAGSTLSDLRRFLVDKSFRAKHLEAVADAEVRFYWQHEFPLLKGTPQAPILTRLDAFLRPRLIRNMVCQRKSSLNFRQLLDGRGIFLGKLSQGAIGQENAQLLGALLVSKLQQVALSRQDQDKDERRDFFLYLDEFHHFATPSLVSLLSGIRKYRMGLVLAHQNLAQLGGRGSDLTDSVLSCAGTRVVFRVGDGDAKDLAGGFANFSAADLQSLSVGETICRVERADFDFNVRTVPLPQAVEADGREVRAAIRDLSRKRFATLRVEVEEALRLPEPVAATPPPTQPAASPAVEAAPAQEPPTPTPVPAVETPAPRSRLPRARGAEPSAPGRGGQQHKYLQSLIKRIGEDRGYRASVEQQVLDGVGWVDVALGNQHRTIACEITITTSVEHEIANLQKCLAAGFAYVMLIATEPRHLTKLRAAAEAALPEAELTRVRCLTPEGLIGFLNELAAAEQTREQLVGGFKVKTKFRALEPEQEANKADSISRAILNSLKRLDPRKRED